MTLQMLQAATAPQSSDSSYIPTGTDHDEWEQWRKLNPDGEIYTDDVADLLSDAGLSGPTA